MDETTAGLAMLAGQLAWTNKLLVERIAELEAQASAATVKPGK